MAKDSNSINRETFEQIESYLLEQMTKESRLQFEAQMKADKALAAEVNLQRELFAAVEAESFFVAHQQETKVNISRSYTAWYMAAAAILVFCAVAFWFIRKDRSGSTENLYAANFQPDPGLPVEMGTVDSTNYIFYDGMISYKENNYKTALSKWERLNKSGVKNDTLQYYVAMAYLNEDSTNKGIAALLQLAKKTDAPFYQQANWYLALAYLKTGDKQSAKNALKQIRDYPGALSLLDKL